MPATPRVDVHCVIGGLPKDWACLTARGHCGQNRARAAFRDQSSIDARAIRYLGDIVSSDSRKFGLFRNAMKTSVHPAGTTVFQEGDAGHSMFAIKRGKVAIVVGGHTVDVLSDEEIFGEMALLEDTTRAASVVTMEETELVEIDKAQFYLLVRQNPHFALQLMQLLSERLRRADALYRKSRTDA